MPSSIRNACRIPPSGTRPSRVDQKIRNEATEKNVLDIDLDDLEDLKSARHPNKIFIGFNATLLFSPRRIQIDDLVSLPSVRAAYALRLKHPPSLSPDLVQSSTDKPDGTDSGPWVDLHPTTKPVEASGGFFSRYTRSMSVIQPPTAFCKPMQLSAVLPTSPSSFPLTPVSRLAG